MKSFSGHFAGLGMWGTAVTLDGARCRCFQKPTRRPN
jgi:hypothetical protein